MSEHALGFDVGPSGVRATGSPSTIPATGFGEWPPPAGRRWARPTAPASHGWVLPPSLPPRCSWTRISARSRPPCCSRWIGAPSRSDAGWSPRLIDVISACGVSADRGRTVTVASGFELWTELRLERQTPGRHVHDRTRPADEQWRAWAGGRTRPVLQPPLAPRSRSFRVSAGGTPSASCLSRSISAFSSAPNSSATFVSQSQPTSTIAPVKVP